MKPIKLTMTAFGPYKDSETVDFRELQENDLYVISGNTGAGKTTIFDGICFALYGTASGEDRGNYAMLRSDFADDNVHTSVELEFELKGHTYRILRQPGHVKQGNKSKTGERYEFFEQTLEGEVPCVDRQIVSEINKKIESLMGLTEDQFKQIVMLPQGEFRKLLTSETENKEEILRRLFKTDTYKEIGERLQEKRKAAQEVFNNVNQVREEQINSIKAILPKREDGDVFKVLAEEHYNVNQVLEALTQEIKFYTEKVVRDKQAYQEVNEKQTKMHETFEKAKTLNESIGKLEQKQTQLQELTQRQTEMKEKAVQLEKAERAGKIEPEEARLREWQEDEERRKKQQAQAIQALDIAKQSVEKVQATYEQEKAKQTERESASRELDHLQQLQPKVEQVAKDEGQLKGLSENVQKIKQNLDQLTKTVTTDEQTLENNQQQIKVLEEKDSQREAKQKEFDELKETVKKIMNYNELKIKTDKFKQVLNSEKQALETEKINYQQQESIWLNNQAVVLANHLHDGEACPVCGSADHPAKAVEQSGDVTREKLDELKKLVSQREDKHQQAANDYSRFDAVFTERKNELIDLGIALENVEQVYTQLTEKGTVLRQETNELLKNKQNLDELKKAIDQLQANLKQTQQAKETKNTFYQQEYTKYVQAKAGYDERVSVIPEELRNLNVLQKQLREKEVQKQTLEQQWDVAQKNVQTAKEAYTKAEANVNHVKTQLAESKQKRVEAGERFNEELQKWQFTTEEEYRDAKLELTVQTSLKEEIDQFNQKLSMLKEQVNELKSSLEGKEKADLNNIELQLNELKAANEQAITQWNQSIEYEKQATTVQERITASTEKVRESEAEFNQITDLYDVIRGNNSKKVSFERYLQIDYLDQIIEVANHRLRSLSNGQYSLIRSERQESHGKQSGLALDVYDEYTGQMRDVKSLSGGEKFNASLCLALGMSDVIQSFQGNIQIETMFIDEGFGTLDEEALNKAIDTLIELQESGRMIGVISHVKELKSIFPAVLEVKKTKEGYSETKFIVK